MTIRSLGGALVLLGLAAAVVHPRAQTSPAQTPPAQTPPPQTPPAGPPSPSQTTFRSTIDSVSVDVAVTDRQGRPVTDLTIDDFELRENKQPQKVEQFKLIQIDAAPEAAPPDVLTPEAHAREVAREDTRLIVIFLDDYHVRRSNSQRIRQQVAFFVSQLSSRDLVAVMYPLTPPSALTFTYDHDGLAGAIARFEGRKYDYSPRNGIEAQYQMFTPEQQEQIRNNFVIEALTTTATYLGTLREGRKAILMVSEGLSSTLAAGAATTGTILGNPGGRTPANQSAFASSNLISDMTRIFQAASRSNTSIYTLDPRGLGDSEFSVADRVSPEVGREMLSESIDVLRTIASQTDGRAIVNRNDPLPALRQMLTDVGSYYLLGYTTKPPYDGRFREIQVRVKRNNVDVHARRGFWARTENEVAKATAPPKPEPPRDLASALEVVTAEESARGPVRVWMGAARGPAGKALVTLAWETTAATQPADVMDAVDHVNVTATSIYGDTLFKGVIARDPQAQRPTGVTTFEAPAGAVAARVVAENARGLRLDTAEASFEVPNLSGAAPIITPPFVYRGRTVRDLQLLRAAASPLPAMVRSFSRTERLLVRFQVIAPASPAPVVALRLLNQQGALRADLPPPAALADGAFEFELGLSSLPPAIYLIEITADAGGAKGKSLMAIRVTGS